MTEWIGWGTIGAVALAVALLGRLAYVRLSGYQSAGRAEAAPVTDFEQARYEPLARLMAGDDLNFLRRQEQCGPELAAQWNRARKRIVRLYLNELASDFRNLHAQARALAADAPEQYSELPAALMRQQVVFWRVLMAIELRLVFRPLEVQSADARKLIGILEAMRTELARSSASAPA